MGPPDYPVNMGPPEIVGELDGDPDIGNSANAIRIQPLGHTRKDPKITRDSDHRIHNGEVEFLAHFEDSDRPSDWVSEDDVPLVLLS